MVQTKTNDATASESADSKASRIAKEVENGASAHAAAEINKLKQTNPAEYQKVLASVDKEISSYNSAHNSHLPTLEIVSDSYKIGSKNGNTTVTDAKGNVTEFKSINGKETSTTTDKNDKIQQTDEYNTDGSIKSQTTYKADGKTKESDNQFQYDANGTLTGFDRTEYGTDGKTVKGKTHGDVHYDAKGNVASEDETRYRADGTTVIGKTHSDFHYGSDGKLTGADSTEYGADGKTVIGQKHVDEHYDSNGKLISADETSYQADGKTRKATTHSQYDANGNITASFETEYQSDGKTRSNQTYTKYDANGDATSENKTVFQADGVNTKTESETEYDTNGDIKTEHEKTYDEANKIVQRSDTANGQTTVTDIDPKTEKATGYTRIDKDGTETHFAANGTTKTSQTKYTNDANGRPTSSEETVYGADGKTVTGYIDTQYNANGDAKTESSYAVGKDGKRIPKETKSYEYDGDGDSKGYYDQKYDSDGKPTVRPYVEASDSN